MAARFWMILALAIAGTALSGCVPLVVGGGLIVADEVMEQEQGGDGLF